MLESLIQFLNEHMESLYSIIRRFVDYAPLKESAEQLDETKALLAKTILKQKGYALKSNQYCLITRNRNKMNLLILNERNRLYRQVNVPMNSFDDFSNLDERYTYYMVG